MAHQNQAPCLVSLMLGSGSRRKLGIAKLSKANLQAEIPQMLLPKRDGIIIPESS